MPDGAPPTEGPSPAPPAASRGRWVACAAGLLLAAGGAAVVFWWRTPAPRPPAALADDDDPEEQLRASDPGYLGPGACADCHARRVAEFLKTRHALACCPPRPGEMPLGFAPGRGTHPTRHPGLRFELTRSGDDFIQTAVRTTPSGESRTPATIALVYGAGGGLDEVYFAWKGDALYELPVVWLHPQKRWGNISLNRYGTGHFGRPTTTRCLECHNTWVEHVPGSANRYRRDHMVLGVTCERCHGPGREHAAFHRAHPDADSARAVVHPGRLSRERQLEVCTQCHGNSPKHRRPPFSYRPGEPLEAYFRTNVSRHPEEDHVANQVQYLRQSKCFQKSDLTCTTCHDPHRPADHAAVQKACLGCHQPADCAERARLPAAVRDRCAACHMPARVWMNVHFHTEDDEFVPPIRRHQHRIAVHPEARDEVLLAWYRTQPDARSRREADRLTRGLVKRWLAEADQRRREHRFLAAIGAVREALRLDPSPATRARLRELTDTQARLNADLNLALYQYEQRRFGEAAETLQAVLAVKPDHAVAHGKLGTLYAMAQRRDLADRHLEAVARCDPNDPYGFNMLGWTAYLEGRADDALKAFRRADAIEPFSAEIAYRMGLAQMKRGRWPEAAASFRRALAVDPNYAGGHQGLAHALRRLGRADEALRFARRAARLTRYENADVLMTLAEAYADAGRFTEAEAAAARALAAAQAGSAAMVPQIHARLAEFRARARAAAR